ncbi:probable tetraacyldisaccharide 4'-kinase, mitochondrial [Oryza brachyantha]|uniref:probable tetraacyldisaccharide 4'-kinase, mitochondrial n=1 Tax=Oryza brachyantha TaxID=4533 RepID=UPI001ADC8203|nr:probable tetraacyldisaccharide 4'-kinase, mitochondrial [Oryza brachyantha]
MLRRLLGRIAATPDSAVPSLPFLHRALLLPLLSAAASALRLLSLYYRPRPRALPVPLVSVGNLTWGGNGKTPMVDFLARSFHHNGVSPLLLTRGYAGGDESRMLCRRLSDTSAKIAVGANRAALATSMLTKYGYYYPHLHLNDPPSPSAKIGVAILDDGMQHRSLFRDLDIVMVNALTPWGNTHLIPRGPLREPLTALTRAHIVVIHHANLVSEAQLKTILSTIQDNGATCPVFSSKLAPSHIFEVNQPAQRLPLHVLHNIIVLCVSAIGCPDAFIHSVKEIGPLKIERLDFSDHHFFRAHDLQLIQDTLTKLVHQHKNDAIVLVTEKDYDRDPDALRTLDAKVLVLSSCLQIIPHEAQGDDEFMRKVREIIATSRNAKLEREMA